MGGLAEVISVHFEDIDIQDPLYPGFIGEIVIDTWCITEPSLVAMVGLGSLVLIRCSRKQNKSA